MCATALLGPWLPAQINDGQSIAALTISSQTGQMYRIDHDVPMASPLTLPAALSQTPLNCVTMRDVGQGFVGTAPRTGTADVYGITITGDTVAATRLNSTPTSGSGLSQIVELGGRLYFSTAAFPGGTLESVPVSGGEVRRELDVGRFTSVRPNAVAAIGSTIYIATYNVSTFGETSLLLAFDTTTRQGDVVMALPRSLHNGSNYSSVSMIPFAAQPGTLAILGVYGDVLVVDPDTRSVVSHELAGSSTQVNSFAWDPNRGDLVVGTRSGHIERIADGHSAARVIPGVGQPSAGASVTGIWHFPAAQGSDVTAGRGCRGQRFTPPTDVGLGLPTPGNTGFRAALFSGQPGSPVVLLVGTASAALPLDGLGAPGCVVRTLPSVTVPAVLSSAGSATIPMPIPVGVQGTFWRQWAEIESYPTTSLGIALSNVRRSTIP
ncbi:MAG: hypothetical protein AAF628_15500 [Planctomycetota bacterium]